MRGLLADLQSLTSGRQEHVGRTMKDPHLDASPVGRGIDIPPFYAGQIGSHAAAKARSGFEIVPMHFGQPTEGAAPAALAAARNALVHGPQGYWESESLRGGASGAPANMRGVPAAAG